MYTIEPMEYGYRLTFAGIMDAREMEAWLEASREVLAQAPASFGVLTDRRNLLPLPPAAQEIMTQGEAFYREKGMKRSAVILHHPVTTWQLQRLAQASGVYAWERYIDASAHPHWYHVGVAWVQDGIDPDGQGV